MSYYSNPTANAALGNINREWNRMSREADRIRRRKSGQLTQQELAAASKRFTGIFRILLGKAMTDDEDTPCPP